jgi:hypothetical protein
MKSKLLQVLLITLLIAYVVYRLFRLVRWITPLLIEAVILIVAILCAIWLFKQHKSKGEK